MTNWEKVTLPIKWSRIAAVGNNPYAKLSVAAPIVAPLALYTDKVANFFNSSFSLDLHSSGMPWLYFSLISLSLAQFCYNGWAPPEIKEYRSRGEYAASGGADLRLKEWEIKAIDLVNLELARGSTLLPAVDTINIEQLEFNDPGRNQRYKAFLNSLKEKSNISRLTFSVRS